MELTEDIPKEEKGNFQRPGWEDCERGWGEESKFLNEQKAGNSPLNTDNPSESILGVSLPALIHMGQFFPFSSFFIFGLGNIVSCNQCRKIIFSGGLRKEVLFGGTPYFHRSISSITSSLEVLGPTVSELIQRLLKTCPAGDSHYSF